MTHRTIRYLCLTMILVAGVAGTATLSVADSLIDHWSMEEGSGATTADVAPISGGDTGDLSGPTWETTPANLPPVPSGSTACLSFDGGDKVEIAGYRGVTGSVARTCAAWIKTTANDGDILFWGASGNGARWLFRIQDDIAGSPIATLRVEIYAGGATAQNTVLSDGQWHHVACVAPDGAMDADIRLYVDGQPETIVADNGTRPVTTGNLYDVLIGDDIGVKNRDPFNGMIDDVRIYDYAMTDEEVFNLYGTAPPPPPPKGVVIVLR